MTNFILHIGRHKTGTSTLQKFLADNRRELQELGYFYPPTRHPSRIAHHDIAQAFASGASTQSSESAPEQSEAVRRLADDVKGIKEAVLLSSEAFQNAHPPAMARYFKPTHTRIIVYVREQVDYIVSAYQQRVHARDHFLPLDVSAKALTTDFDAFLGKWEQAFGKENLEVRVYDRSSLKGGDIVTDFLEVLGIRDTDALTFDSADQNPSIGGSLLEFKRHLNACNLSDVHHGRLYRALSKIAASDARFRRKPLLDSATAQKVRESVAESNQRVFDRYFEGKNVFASNTVVPAKPDNVNYASELREIMSALQKIEPLVFKQLCGALARKLPETSRILELQQRSPEINYLSANKMLLDLLRDERGTGPELVRAGA